MAVFASFSSSHASTSNVFGSNWVLWQFQSSSPFTITTLDIYCKKVGAPSGNFVVSIRRTDGSFAPTGGELCSGSPSASTVSTTAGLFTITMSPAFVFQANTIYTMLFRVPSGDSSNYIQIAWDRGNNYPSLESAASYPVWGSSDGGSTFPQFDGNTQLTFNANGTAIITKGDFTSFF